jgi:hypothetical protein
MQRHPHANSRTPEPQIDRQASNSDPPDTPGVLESFDWDEFEARYEAALRDADEQEREILKEADALAKVTFMYLIACDKANALTVFQSLGSRSIST